jgi:hypothetical protein
MPAGSDRSDDPGMASVRRLIVELEVITGEHEPIQGRVRAPGLASRSFSGWSELFAALQALVGGPEGGSGNEGGQ